MAAQSSTPSREYSGLTKVQQIKHCARVLFGAYRKDQFADPDGFLIQAGTVFEQYDPLVIRHVTDVREHDCLQRTYGWPPSIKEISDACDAEAARQARVRAAANQPKMIRYIPPPVDLSPGARARVFVGQDVPQYSELTQLAESGELDPLDWRYGISPTDKSKTGIWIALSLWESRYRLRALSKSWKPMTDAELYAHYGRREAEAAKAAKQESPAS